VTPTLTDLMTRVTITPTVTTAPLVANFTWPDETMTPMVPVNFTDCSTGTPTQWFWEVENETFTTQIITHTFMDPGTFTVNLTVEDADGETATIVKEIEVAAPATITSIPESQVTTMTTPDPTVTDSSATSPDAGAPATMVTMAAPGPRDRLR
jgi:PKD repeat protein